MTNQATRVGAELDKNGTVTAGELLPKTESEVRVDPDGLTTAAKSALGAKCDPVAVNGVLVEIANPPKGNPSTDVMHVITLASGDCGVADVWLPPASVIPLSGKRRHDGLYRSCDEHVLRAG